MKDGVVLDVGANIGNHTLYFANECKANKIISFEPVKDTFAMLQENIKINQLENTVILINKGVGEKSTKARISVRDINNSGGTQLTWDENGDIEVVAIDEMDITEKVVFIKIDVEGLEKSVLKGAVGLIQRDKPYLVVEAFNDSIIDVSAILMPLGYHFEQISRSDYLFYPAK